MPDRPLIGVDDIATPSWAKGYESTANAGLRAVAREAPRTVGIAVRAAWAAAPGLAALVAALELLTGAVTAFGLLATADVFTRLLAQGPTPERLVGALPAIAAVVAALAARGLLDAAVAGVTGSLEPLVQQRAEDQLHAAAIAVELAAFDDADFTEQVSQAHQGVGRISTAVRQTGDLMAALVSVAASVTAAAVLQPLLAPLVLLAALPQGWASVRSARVMFESFVRMNSARRRSGVTSHLITSRDSAAEVRAFTAQEMLLGEHRRIAAAMTAESVRVNRRRTVLQLVGRSLSGVGTGLSYLVMGLLIYAGVLPLALAGAAAVAMRTASGAVSRVIFGINQLYEASFALEIYRSCLAGAATRRRAPGTATLPGDPAAITLDGVTFRYPEQADRAVDGISATLRRGEVIALVGENGSGKSTLAKLITGLYLPEAGTVAWDGVDTRSVDAAALHERVAVVMQEPLRWPMSAADNVRVGRIEHHDPDDARLTDSARRSGADAVAAELPQGWSTVLSRMFQSGRDLSGGQWQRVSVARGLYRDAPVVVADEPTAALDARAESAVFATLRALTGTGKITVLVTHRLANVRHADQILVMERGRLVEHGVHDELMDLGGVYAELFGIQARAYADGG